MSERAPPSTDTPLPADDPDRHERSRSLHSMRRNRESLHEGAPLLRTYTDCANLLDAESEPEPKLSGKTARLAGFLRRRSAFISDFISNKNHSAWTTPVGDCQDTDDDDEDRASTVASVRRVVSRRGNGYDGEFRHELEGDAGNGVRQWYDNFHSIDWVHDAIKASLRTRKIRTLKKLGLGGWLRNLWDGSQGWVLVTIVGFCTAIIAFFVIRSEGLLFDLKSGYCTTNFRLAKRFCCPSVHVRAQDVRFEGAFSPYAPITMWSNPRTSEEECKNWRTWSQFLTGAPVDDREGIVWQLDYLAYILIAVALSTLSSHLTLYFSASTGVYSSKDSPSVPYPGFNPDFPIDPSMYGTFPQTPFSHEKLPPPRPRKVMYFAAGSGIPEIKTILSGFVIRGYLGTWTLITKSVGLALSVASGLSLGKEGPFVHIASCVGNIASRFFPKYDLNEARRREIISAACAGGVAVSFGAPVGGTLFSLEEVSYYFPPRVMWRSFWCAMIAAVSLKYFDPFGSGKIVLFQVTYDRDWHSFELIGAIILGIFGGLYGAIFCKANIWWTRNVRNGTKLKSHPIVEVALVTLATVVFSFYNTFTKMGGTELVAELFSECYKENSNEELCAETPSQAWNIIWSIAFALVTKGLLTIVTFGIKLPAGIFIPTLAIGACFGRILGLLVEITHSNHAEAWLFESCRQANESGPLPFGQSCVLPGVWAMVGAAATLAGVTRTTVSLAVIMFELTGTLNYTVPVMISVLVAKSVADAVEPRGIYDLVIELSDLPYLDAKAEYLHDSPPSAVVDENAPVICLQEINTLKTLRYKLAKLYSDGSGAGFPIVSEEDDKLRVYGYIASKELEHGLANASISLFDESLCTFKACEAVRDEVPFNLNEAVTSDGHDFSWLVEMAPLTINVRSPMELVHEMFSKLGARYLIVVDDKGYYIGVIEKTLYLRYLQFVERNAHEGHLKGDHEVASA